MSYIFSTKKIIFKAVLSLSTAVFLIGCSEAVEKASDLSQSVQAEVLDPNVIDLEIYDQTVIGIYSQYRSATQFNNVTATTWAGDDITVIPTKLDISTFDNRGNDFTSGRILASWNDLFGVYNSIFDAIDILTENFEVNKSSATLVDGQFFEVYIAELRFLRAQVLHYYARVHGRAPVIEGFGIAPNGLTDTLELYQTIEEDLLFAEEFLRDKHPKERGKVGAARPNKGSARALLARLYMDWAGWPIKDVSKYTLATEKSKLVIDKAADHGFALLSNFEDLWLLSNARNEEAVFMVAFSAESAGERQDNRKYGQLGLVGTGVGGEQIGGWDETFSEIRFWEDFPEGPRKDGTYRQDLEADWPNYPDLSNPVYTKIAGPRGDLGLVFSTSRSDFHIRYADVLLMYAEASGRAGMETAEAWEALNQVRRRAYPAGTPDVGPGDGDLGELAFTERKWEFAGEFLRWFDLVRMERVEEALGGDARTPQTTRNSAGELLKVNVPISRGASLGTDNYFAPIPQAILSENPSFTP